MKIPRFVMTEKKPQWLQKPSVLLTFFRQQESHQDEQWAFVLLMIL